MSVSIIQKFQALREGETLLGNITENDILGNMEEIDFDNLDLNELLLDGDEDDDEDETMDNVFGGIISHQFVAVVILLL